ncbi:MAG TPA: hypothetical protein VEO20_02215 [Thermoplasmata archaeon]|nr:hypothetical protein [Thermoplasmata archaeon]
MVGWAAISTLFAFALATQASTQSQATFALIVWIVFVSVAAILFVAFRKQNVVL